MIYLGIYLIGVVLAWLLTAIVNDLIYNFKNTPYNGYKYNDYFEGVYMFASWFTVIFFVVLIPIIFYCELLEQKWKYPTLRRRKNEK